MPQHSSLRSFILSQGVNSNMKILQACQYLPKSAKAGPQLAGIDGPRAVCIENTEYLRIMHINMQAAQKRQSQKLLECEKWRPVFSAAASSAARSPPGSGRSAPR